MRYLVTFSNGSEPIATTSKHEALRLARLSSPGRIATEFHDGNVGLYRDRSDLHRDRSGAAPHLIQAVVRPIRHVEAFLADYDTPALWRDAVAQTFIEED